MFPEQQGKVRLIPDLSRASPPLTTSLRASAGCPQLDGDGSAGLVWASAERQPAGGSTRRQCGTRVPRPSPTGSGGRTDWPSPACRRSSRTTPRTARRRRARWRAPQRRTGSRRSAPPPHAGRTARRPGRRGGESKAFTHVILLLLLTRRSPVEFSVVLRSCLKWRLVPVKGIRPWPASEHV